MAETKEHVHVIDCDADPFVPEGLQVEEHQKGGSFTWDPKMVRFYLSNLQQNGKYIRGEKLRAELRDKQVVNANVLDYLFRHPHLIPEEWKRDEESRTRCIFFWGTIYRYSDGRLSVRYLAWSGDRWYWRCTWLGYGWDVFDPAALRAS